MAPTGNSREMLENRNLEAGSWRLYCSIGNCTPQRERAREIDREKRKQARNVSIENAPVRRLEALLQTTTFLQTRARAEGGVVVLKRGGSCSREKGSPY